MLKNTEVEDVVNQLKNIEYLFNDMYGITYITLESFNRYIDLSYKLRELNDITDKELSTILSIGEAYYKQSIKIKELDAKNPRFVAQKFIRNKQLRMQIFNRDGNMFLNCKSTENLEIDHIMPISKGGENHIDNLQTLCKRCNCSKSNKYKDFRNG